MTLRVLRLPNTETVVLELQYLYSIDLLTCSDVRFSSEIDRILYMCRWILKVWEFRVGTGGVFNFMLCSHA